MNLKFHKLLPILLLIMLLATSRAYADQLKPFTSDGCSVFPDGSLQQQSLWLNCCIRHDLAYWQGGSYDERQLADQSLAQCVAKVGEPEVAKIMLAGVRIGGSPYFPTSYRWGYGWSFPRGYKILSDEEKTQVREKIESLQIMVKSLAEELKQTKEK